MNNTLTKVAYAMDDVAEAWEAEQGKFAADGKEEVAEALGDRMKRYGRHAGEFTGVLGKQDQKWYQRAGRGAGTAAVLGAGAYGVHKLRQKKQEKKASYSDWMFEKLATGLVDKHGMPLTSKSDEIAKEGLGARMRRYGKNTGEFTGVLGKGGKQTWAGRGGRLAGTGAVLGLGAYGAKKYHDSKKQKKVAMFLDAGYEALALAEAHEPYEFAKEAEYRAAEILAANGIHPETFEEIRPEEIKVASFPGVEHAADEHEAEALYEYNQMLDDAAIHIIDNLFD